MKKKLMSGILIYSFFCVYSQNALLLYRQNDSTPLFISIKDISHINHSDSTQTIVLNDGNIKIETFASDIDSLFFIDTDTLDNYDFAYLFCPDNNHPHKIDLGLPSGTLWACCNVDASKPEEYGGYYAWGETEEKEDYNWSSYIHCDGSWETCHDLNDEIAGTDYDVAHVKWGDSWVMPSYDQIQELYYNCEYSWQTINHTEGGIFKSKEDGVSIFMPAAGYFDGSSNPYINIRGDYNASTRHPFSINLAFAFFFAKRDAYLGVACPLYLGNSVRPVCK